MRQLVLTEYQTAPAIQLASDERDALHPSITVVPCVDAPGHYDLTPGSWVGGISVGSFEIEIRPKIPIDRLIFLISYSLYRRRWQESPFAATDEPDLVEAIVISFVAHVRRALSRGVLQGYRVEEDSLHTVRGRIRFDDQIRNRYGTIPPVEVRYDEFTEDIEENQLIKAAVARLGRMHIRSTEARRSLRTIDTILSNVLLVEYNARQLPDITYTRLNDRYRPALELAKLILRSTSYELRHGGTQTSAFLIDMNQVFEDFVILALRDQLRVPELSFPQEAHGRRLRLDAAEKIRLYPDLSWWDGQQCCFVGDAKYKRTRPEGAIHSDLYQILAYAIATDLDEGMLIYAAGEDGETCHEIVNIGRRIWVNTLDLDGTPEEILSQIGRIAGEIQRMRQRAIQRDRPTIAPALSQFTPPLPYTGD